MRGRAVGSLPGSRTPEVGGSSPPPAIEVSRESLPAASSWFGARSLETLAGHRAWAIHGAATLRSTTGFAACTVAGM